MSMTERLVLETWKSLPARQRAEVEDFVEFLAARTKNRTPWNRLLAIASAVQAAGTASSSETEGTERPRVTSDAAVCQGKACIEGTDISVAMILDNLAAGRSAEEIVSRYPALTTAGVASAIEYAAELART